MMLMALDAVQKSLRSSGEAVASYTCGPGAKVKGEVIRRCLARQKTHLSDPMHRIACDRLRGFSRSCIATDGGVNLELMTQRSTFDTQSMLKCAMRYCPLANDFPK